MNKLDVEIGEKLKTIRERLDLSIREAARRIDMDHSYLARIEKGKIPSLEKLKQICDTYGIPIQSLFGKEVTTPNKLKEIGVEWIAFVEGMKEREFTPEEVEKMIKVVQAFKNL